MNLTMSENSEKLMEISVSAIAMIHKACAPLVARLESSIEDHYNGTYEIGKSELTSLMEIKISADILLNYLGELLEQAAESEVDKLVIPPQEVTLIASLAKTINASEIIKFGNLSLREH